MYSVIKNNDDSTYGITELVINTVADLASVPTSYASGSSCLCIETSDVYMLSVPDEDGNKEWKRI